MADDLDQSQVERFKEIARLMECDDDEARWNERLKNVTRHKSPEKPE